MLRDRVYRCERETGAKHLHLNQQSLRTLYANDEVTRTLLNYLAERKRAPDAVSADVLLEICTKAGLTTTREACIAALRGLGDAGAGQFLTGRRGQVTRIRFALGGRVVGLVGTGKQDMPSEDAPAQPSPTSVEKTATPKAQAKGGFELSALRALSADDLRIVITYATKALELAEMEGGTIPPQNGYGRRRSDLRIAN